MSAPKVQKHVAVVGTGLVGCLMALGLANRFGWSVDIYDSRSPAHKSVDDNKAINLALSDRGIRAFREVDPWLADEMVRVGVPLAGRLVHDAHGRKDFQAYGPHGETIFSINRATMNKLLNEAVAASELVRMNFNSKLVQLVGNRMVFENPTTRERFERDADLVIGADGVFSTVRDQMRRQIKMNTSTIWAPLSYIKIEVPPNYLPNGETEHALEPSVLHLWPRQEFLLIAPSNPDKTFTCVLWAPDALLGQLKDREFAREFFQREFPTFLQSLPLESAVEQAATADLVPMCTVKCHPLNLDNNIILIGDAAHTIVPYLGHGANVGFEDVRILLDHLAQQHGEDIALRKYSDSRKDDLEAIDGVSWNHIKELDAAVLTRTYLARKALDFALARTFPQAWAPLYAAIMFDTETSYAKVVARNRRQETILRAVALLLIGMLCIALMRAMGISHWAVSTVKHCQNAAVGGNITGEVM